MQMLLFDIDGTLLYTGGAGKIAFNRAADEVFGIKECWGQIRADGKTDPLLIREVTMNAVGRFPTSHEADAIRRLYTKYFEEEIATSERFRVMPGVHDLLERINRKHFLVGLATGNFEATARLKLKRANLNQYFAFGGFGCDSADRSELVRSGIVRGQAKMEQLIQAESICVIGDTPADIQSGRTLGVRTMGVATGRFSQSDLMASGADFVLQDFSNAEAFLEFFKRNGFS